MRAVYKGNLSIPHHIIDEFLEAHESKSIDRMVQASNALVASLKMAKEKIARGLEESNLTVCIGKACYVNPIDLRRLLSGEIDRLTMYRTGKSNHAMPLYFKHKPSEYVKRAAIIKSKEKKERRNGKA